MQYIQIEKDGVTLCMGAFTVIGRSNHKELVLEFSIIALRSRMAHFMKKALRKITPEEKMVSWDTTIGTFTVYKEYDYDEHAYASKFRKVFYCVELSEVKKEEVKTRRFFIRKEPNPDCESYENCVCGSHEKAMYVMVVGGEKELRCKECKKTERIINKIARDLNLKDRTRKKKK